MNDVTNEILRQSPFRPRTDQSSELILMQQAFFLRIDQVAIRLTNTRKIYTTVILQSGQEQKKKIINSYQFGMHNIQLNNVFVKVYLC